MVQKILYSLAAFQFTFLPLLTGSPETLDKQEAGAALIKQNEEIAQEAEVVKELYELKDGEQWRDITDEVLASSDTPDMSKDSIRHFQRRIYVFKYPSDNLWIKGFISFTPHPEYHPLLILYRWGNQDFALMNPGVTLATYKDYTVISSMLRGGVSEGEDEFGGKDVNDMKNLIKYIPHIARDIGVHLEPSCVFMLGPSRGGMEMFLTLAHFPELQKRVNKVVALSAILDMRQLIQDRPFDMKVMLQNQFGLGQGDKANEWINKRDPIQAIKALNPSIPVLIVQGTKDERISLNQSRHMVDALKQNGHDVSYWEVKGGDHVLMNHPFIMNDITKWLETNSPCMSIRLSRDEKGNQLSIDKNIF